MPMGAECPRHSYADDDLSTSIMGTDSKDPMDNSLSCTVSNGVEFLTLVISHLSLSTAMRLWRLVPVRCQKPVMTR